MLSRAGSGTQVQVRQVHSNLLAQRDAEDAEDNEASFLCRYDRLAQVIHWPPP